MIRPARAEDEPAIRACVEAAYSRYIAAIGGKPAPMLADYAAEIAAGQVYVAVDGDDTLLGLVAFFPDAGAMLLENVAVHPAAAGRGIGKALIAYCEEAARQQNLPAVRLYTNVKMVGNLSIYPHLGYVEIARRHENGFDRVYFEKQLA